MKLAKNFIYIFLFACVQMSCNSQKKSTVTLTIYNKTGKVIDSLFVYDVFSKKIAYRNVDKDSTIVRVQTLNQALLPNSERTVYSVIVFEDKFFYNNSTGFIGFPTARLNDHYEFFIYNDYIAVKQDATGPHNKEPISEFIPMENEQ